MERMKNLQQNDSAFTDIFEQIPIEISNTFNEEQIEAIKKAFCFQNGKRNPVELQVFVPILGLKLYLGLMNSKQYSKHHLLSKKRISPFWKPGNFALMIIFLIVLSTSSFITFPFLFSSIISSVTSISNSPPSPTSIPWLENQFDCEHTGRTWRNGKCWDWEHNPLF
jgi:hypothetical protein